MEPMNRLEKQVKPLMTQEIIDVLGKGAEDQMRKSLMSTTGLGEESKVKQQTKKKKQRVKQQSILFLLSTIDNKHLRS